MPVEIAPVVGRLAVEGRSCVCGHGITWHGEDTHRCTYIGGSRDHERPCECGRYRPAITSDGSADGMYSSHGGEVITDHPFEALKGEPWGLCAFDLHGLKCRRAESAHEYSATPYVP